MASRAEEEDVRRIQGKLEQVLPAVKGAVKAVALEVKGMIATAPPQPTHKMRFKTGRQRTYVLAAIREGLIDVPYRRAMSPGSEALSKSWTISEINDGLGAVVGNDTSYGPLVQDREKQSLFHQETGWITVQDVQEQMQLDTEKKFGAAVRVALETGKA